MLPFHAVSSLLNKWASKSWSLPSAKHTHTQNYSTGVPPEPNYPFIKQHINVPEDCNPHIHCHKNLTSQVCVVILIYWVWWHVNMELVLAQLSPQHISTLSWPNYINLNTRFVISFIFNSSNECTLKSVTIIVEITNKLLQHVSTHIVSSSGSSLVFAKITYECIEMCKLWD